MKIPIWGNAGIPENLSFRSQFHKDTNRNRILLLGMLLVASTFLMHGPGTRMLDLHPGDISPDDYRAPFEIPIPTPGNDPPFHAVTIIPEGTPILQKGTVVTKIGDEALKVIKIHQTPKEIFASSGRSLILGSLLIIGLLLVFESIVLPPPKYETINRPRTFAIFSFLVVVLLIIDRDLQNGLLAWMENLPSTCESELLVFSLSTVIGSVLVSIFPGQRLAAVTALSFGVILSITLAYPPWPGFYSFLISVLAGSTPYGRSLLGLMETGVLIGFFSFFLSFLFHYWKGSLLPFEPLTPLAFSICGGLMVSMIVSRCQRLIERGLGALSDVALTEFLDVDHPLLRAFFQHAPGACQHSMALSYLTELARLRKTFVQTLVSTHYHRIPYLKSQAKNSEFPKTHAVQKSANAH